MLTPFTVSRLYVVDKEKNMLEQFEMIPGISVQYVIAKMTLVLAVHALLFFPDFRSRRCHASIRVSAGSNCFAWVR